MGRCDPCSPCNICGLPVVGVYPLCNVGGVIVHEVDTASEKVLASVNYRSPEWCDITDEFMECTGKWVTGFWLGHLWILLNEVIRMEGC